MRIRMCSRYPTSYRKETENETCGCQLTVSKRFLFPFLQYFATPKFALAFLCLVSVSQGFVISGLYSVVVTTIEKRFHLHSTESGLIASSYDISSCLSVLFITYIGGKGHKPIWIGWGVFFLGLGTITFTLPHFLAPTYQYGVEEHNVCNVTIVQGECTGSSLRHYMGIFVVAMLLNGIGGTTLFTLGVTYLDENVAQVDSSLYHGIYYASSVVGPAFGFMLGGKFLTFYTNLYEEVTIDNSSTLWIGAWWLGFLIGGITILILSIPILLLPKQIPNTAHLRINREVEMHQDRVSLKDGAENFSFRPSHICRSVLILFRNPTFFFITLAGSLDSSLVIGITTFGPKYLQSMFSLTPSQAATYFGILAILAGATGQLLGGVIVTKFKLEVPGILKFCVVCATVAVVTTFVFFKTCPDTLFAGATTNYSNAASKLSSVDHNSACNLPCNCNPDSYDPVCGEDDITYYSPCFAGCQQKKDTHYFNCSCILNSTNVTGGLAKTGKCLDQSCGGLSLFLGIFFFSILATFLTGTPAIQAILRVVPFQQRSFAIGVKFVILRIFGSIPGPIIFGRVLDLACVVWSTECGKQGACELYNNTNLASHMSALILTIKVLVVLFFAIAWWSYKPPLTENLQDEAPRFSQITRNNVGLPTSYDINGGISDLMGTRSSMAVGYSILNNEVNLDCGS